MSSFLKLRALVIDDEPWIAVDDLVEIMNDHINMGEMNSEWIQTLKILDENTQRPMEIEMVSLFSLMNQKEEDDSGEHKDSDHDHFMIQDPIASATYKKLSVADLYPDYGTSVIHETPVPVSVPAVEPEAKRELAVPERIVNQEPYGNKEELAVKVRAYLNRQLPSDWGKLDAMQRLSFLDNSELPGRLIRDKVTLEEIIIECLRRPQEMNNLHLQSTLTDIMASFPEWQRVRSIRPYKPYRKGVGYKRIY